MFVTQDRDGHDAHVPRFVPRRVTSASSFRRSLPDMCQPVEEGVSGGGHCTKCPPNQTENSYNKMLSVGGFNPHPALHGIRRVLKTRPTPTDKSTGVDSYESKGVIRRRIADRRRARRRVVWRADAARDVPLPKTQRRSGNQPRADRDRQRPDDAFRNVGKSSSRRSLINASQDREEREGTDQSAR